MTLKQENVMWCALHCIKHLACGTLYSQTRKLKGSRINQGAHCIKHLACNRGGGGLTGRWWSPAREVIEEGVGASALEEESDACGSGVKPEVL